MTPTAPRPWQVVNGGLIVDANGREVAWIAPRLYRPSALDADGDGWRGVAAQLAAAPDMKEALAELFDYTVEILTRHLMADVKWGPDSGPNNAVMQAARRALEKVGAPPPPAPTDALLDETAC
jgi:hypothetical protein